MYIKCFLLLCACSTLATAHQTETTNVPVTIFIHGSTPPPLAFTLINSYKGLPNAFDSFFCCPQGMNRACTTCTTCYGSTIFKCLTDTDPQMFPVEHFYLFGWSGRISYRHRLRAAHQLYDALAQLYVDYRARGIEPLLRIIAHSHAGNVTLNLARVHAELQKIENFIIDEFVMFATPVMPWETLDYAQDPLFKSITHFYSESDPIQILDPQGLKAIIRSLGEGKFAHAAQQLKQHEQSTLGIFAGRRFPDHANIKQHVVAFERKRRFTHPLFALFRSLYHDHIEFLFPEFLITLPERLKNNITLQQPA